MPKGKAKGGRRGALTGAERRAGARQRARENIAMKEIAESCDYFREEWRASGGDAAKWRSLRLRPVRNGTEMVLHLDNEEGYDGIITLPDAIGDLASLEHLFLQGHTNLRTLPDTIGLLEALQSLHLCGCSGLIALPDTIDGLKAISVFDASGCKSLRALPDTFGQLKVLERLILHNCASLAVLPFDIGLLDALTHLDLSGCSSLTRLPHTTEDLSSLTELDASRSGLVEIQLQFPTALRTLDLSGCTSLVALPETIDTVDGLTVIGADDVPRYDDDARIWDRLCSRHCNGCGRQFALDAPKLRVCGRCDAYSYCSIECQRAHWEAHRPLCRRVRKRDRRTCDVCGVQGDLNDPPFPTCHCGEWRYCGEACQVEDWGRGHAEECASGYLYLEGP
jgi:hypothetical protein